MPNNINTLQERLTRLNNTHLDILDECFFALMFSCNAALIECCSSQTTGILATVVSQQLLLINRFKHWENKTNELQATLDKLKTMPAHEIEPALENIHAQIQHLEKLKPIHSVQKSLSITASTAYIVHNAFQNWKVTFALSTMVGATRMHGNLSNKAKL